MLPYANYEAVSLTGSGVSIYPFDSSNYRTATTIHQVFCLSTGSIIITPMMGTSFTWAASAGQSMDVLCSGVTVSSGNFIGFRSRFDQNPFYGKGNQI